MHMHICMHAQTHMHMQAPVHVHITDKCIQALVKSTACCHRRDTAGISELSRSRAAVLNSATCGKDAAPIDFDIYRVDSGAHC